jgi:hypothetical protein
MRAARAASRAALLGASNARKPSPAHARAKAALGAGRDAHVSISGLAQR